MALGTATLRVRGIVSRIVRRSQDGRQHLGRHGRVVERTLALLIAERWELSLAALDTTHMNGWTH